MSIRLKVILLSSLSMALALLISVLALMGSERAMEQSLRFNEAARTTQTLAQALARATTTIKADPILPETATQLEQVNTDLKARLAAAREALSAPDTVELLNAVKQISDAWQAYYQQSLDLSQMAETDPASALGMIESVYQSQFVPLQGQFRQTIEQAAAYSDALANGLRADLRAQRLRILGVLGGTAALLLVLVAVVLVRMKRSVAAFHGQSARLVEGDLDHRFEDSGRDEISRIGAAVNHFLERFVSTLVAVRAAAEQSDTVITNLRQATVDADRNMAAQADEAGQMREAVEQLSLSFREVAQKAAQASDTAAEGEQLVARGNAMGGANKEALASIDQTVSATHQTVAELASAIDEVATVTRAIHDISEQTTLLALNAAIEAARAGSHGRGFAVVADEVKQLSDRTRSLTSDIARIVGAVQEGTGRVHGRLDDARRAIATEQQSAVTVDMNHRIERVASGGEQVQAQMASVLTVVESLEQANTELHGHLGAFRASSALGVRG